MSPKTNKLKCEVCLLFFSGKLEFLGANLYIESTAGEFDLFSKCILMPQKSLVSMIFLNEISS